VRPCPWLWQLLIFWTSVLPSSSEYSSPEGTMILLSAGNYSPVDIAPHTTQLESLALCALLLFTFWNLSSTWYNNAVSLFARKRPICQIFSFSVVYLSGMMVHSSMWKFFIMMEAPLFPRMKFYILLLRSALSSSQISYTEWKGW
jgi:hypothetical protein